MESECYCALLYTRQTFEKLICFIYFVLNFFPRALNQNGNSMHYECGFYLQVLNVVLKSMPSKQLTPFVYMLISFSGLSYSNSSK